MWRKGPATELYVFVQSLEDRFTFDPDGRLFSRFSNVSTHDPDITCLQNHQHPVPHTLVFSTSSQILIITFRLTRSIFQLSLLS